MAATLVMIASQMSSLSPEKIVELESKLQKIMSEFALDTAGIPKGCGLVGAKAIRRGPPKQKRVMNAYMRFAKERRAVIHEAEPELSMAEISKRIGEEWATLTDEQKKPYVDAYEAEKAERVEAMPTDEGGSSGDDNDKKRKNTRRMPAESAKGFEIGTIRTGQDGNEYEVYETPKGRKGWRRTTA